jgi:hypothetical protein
MLLPGGAEAAKRRQQAEAAAVVNGADEDAMGDAYAAALVTPAKRQRVGMQQCWNCGSYDHGISGCPLPLDQVGVGWALSIGGAARQGCVDDGAVPVRHGAVVVGGCAHPASRRTPPPYTTTGAHSSGARVVRLVWAQPAAAPLL